MLSIAKHPLGNNDLIKYQNNNYFIIVQLMTSMDPSLALRMTNDFINQ